VRWWYPVRRHETDVTSLVFGLIFLGLAAIWVLVYHDVIGWIRLGVVVPILLISAGIIGLVASIRSGRRRRLVTVEGPPEPIDESPIDVTADIADALAREHAKRQAPKQDPGSAPQ
jgi:hypothetical protein